MKSHLIVNKKSVSTLSAAVIFTLAIIFGLIGYRDVLFTSYYSLSDGLIKALLPITTCVLMLIVLFVFPKRGFVISTVPFLLVMIAAMVNALELGSLIGYGEIAICLVLAVVFCCTVFGSIKTKFFIIALLILYAAYHIWMVIREQITTSFYTFTQLCTEISMLLIVAGFIVVLFGSTRNNKIKPETATMVQPPIPGANKLSGVKDAPASEPVAKEPVIVIPVEEVKETVSAVDEATCEKSEEALETEECSDSAKLPEAVEKNESNIKKFINKFMKKSVENQEMVRQLDDHAEEIGLFEEKTSK